MFDINTIRNNALDLAAAGLIKLKAKPPTVNTELRKIFDTADLSTDDKLAVLKFLTARLEGDRNA